MTVWKHEIEEYHFYLIMLMFYILQLLIIYFNIYLLVFLEEYHFYLIGQKRMFISKHGQNQEAIMRKQELMPMEITV